MDYNFIVVLLIVHGVYWLIKWFENTLRRNKRPKIKKYSMSMLPRYLIKISF